MTDSSFLPVSLCCDRRFHTENRIGASQCPWESGVGTSDLAGFTMWENFSLSPKLAIFIFTRLAGH